MRRENCNDLLDNNPDIKYRTKIVLLAGDGYTVPEIREMTDIYDKTIRKWIHRFNDYGVKGIFTQMDYSGMIKITDKARNEILHISSTSPRANWFEIFNLVFKVYCRICEGKEAQ